MDKKLSFLKTYLNNKNKSPTLCSDENKYH